MGEKTDWEKPADASPRPDDFTFELDHALNAVLRLEATVPQDAFSAGALGTARAGNAVRVKENGLVLPIGYLLCEAATHWPYFKEGPPPPRPAPAYHPHTAS